MVGAGSMDYEELATEWLIKMSLLRKEKSQKNINEALQGEGLVLGYVASHSDYVLPGEIKQELNVTTARVATALNSLEKKGLVTRQIDPNDRRRILVGMTQEGRAAAEKSQQEIKNVVTKNACPIRRARRKRICTNYKQAGRVDYQLQ